MTEFQTIMAARRRAKRGRQLAKLACRTHLAYDFIIGCLVAAPFLFFLPFAVVGCRLMRRAR